MADLSEDIHSLIQGGIDPVTFEEIRNRRHGLRPPRQRIVARVASVVVFLAVAVPVILAVSSARSTTSPKAGGLARHRVIAALDTTIASGSFDITFSQQPPTSPTTPTTTTTAPCYQSGANSSTGPASSVVGTPTTIAERTTPGPGPSPGIGTVAGGTGWICPASIGAGPGLAISGQGTVDTNPFAMVVGTEVPGFGQITLRDDGTDIWELGGGDYGLAPGSTDSGPGSSLPGFSSLVESTLGARQGASDMMVLANPTGYLELDENAITNADQIGTGAVDGSPVTVYQVTLSPDQEATVTGANTAEATAIQDALGVLKQQGYTGTTVKISIDAAGFIRQTVATASFSDGSSQTGETTFSDFGCAGTVLMPGQQGASSPPPGCVSPDTAPSPTTS